MEERKNDLSAPAPQIQLLSLEEIRTRLKPMALARVAKATGLSTITLYRLAHGEGDPAHSTVVAVSAWLQRHARGEA